MSLSSIERAIADGAGVISVVRMSGMLNIVGPVGSVTGVTRRGKTVVIMSNTRDTPRLGISIRSLSYSFLTFSNRGVYNPANVNILCKGGGRLRGVRPVRFNNRVVSFMNLCRSA